MNFRERTSITNLLHNRQNGTYYARVKVNGKQKWQTLESRFFLVAKLRLSDVERQLRAQGAATIGETTRAGADEMVVAHFIGILKASIDQNALLIPNTKERRESAIKAVGTTWTDLHRATFAESRPWIAVL